MNSIQEMENAHKRINMLFTSAAVVCVCFCVCSLLVFDYALVLLEKDHFQAYKIEFIMVLLGNCFLGLSGVPHLILYGLKLDQFF